MCIHVFIYFHVYPCIHIMYQISCRLPVKLHVIRVIPPWNSRNYPPLVAPDRYRTSGFQSTMWCPQLLKSPPLLCNYKSTNKEKSGACPRCCCWLCFLARASSPVLPRPCFLGRALGSRFRRLFTCVPVALSTKYVAR